MQTEAFEQANRAQAELNELQTRSEEFTTRLQQLESEHRSKDELINNYAKTLEDRNNHVQTLELENQNFRFEAT